MLSVCSLFISLWFVVDFGREQEIVKQLVRDLPARDLPVAEELANELQWQSRWTFFVILQVIATGLANGGVVSRLSCIPRESQRHQGARR
jgi:hypothetical protein